MIVASTRATCCDSVLRALVSPQLSLPVSESIWPKKADRWARSSKFHVSVPGLLVTRCISPNMFRAAVRENIGMLKAGH